MKKIILALAFVLTVFALNAVYAESEISLYIDNQKINCDVPPALVNDRTLVPVRAVFDAFGAKVSWNNDLKQVTIEGDKKIVFTVGSNTATVDSKRVFMDTSPVIINDRCLVPIRFISETLGHSVSWNQNTKSVYITKNQNPSNNNTANTPIENNSYKITDIILKSTSSSQDLYEIKYNGTSAPKMFVLSSSNAIVMDFYDTLLSFGDGKVAIDSSLVKEVRYAKHDGYSRVVIECKSAPDYSTNLSNGVFTVTVKGNGQTASPGTSQPDSNGSTNTGTDSKTFLATRNENNLLVVIDAGHGGTDPGAVYTDENGNTVYEKTPNLYISKKVYEYLKNDGINAVMTRDTDVFVELLDRSEFANAKDADLFVSIHNNSIDNKDVSGCMVLYNGNVTESKYGITGKETAQNINEEIKKIVPITNRGLVSRPNLSVLKRTAMPAVLVECAFGTNPGDLKLLTNNQSLDLFARAIANGIEKSLNTMKQKIIEAKNS